MKISRISCLPPAALARALAEFELPFTYPLGPGKSFHILHGEDYTLFFRAQGNGSCFIAEQDGRVVGTLGTAIRKLWMPDGTEHTAAYLGDLKISPQARGGSALVRLARAAETWLRPQVEAGFCVVMGGTSQSPDAYTGRVGIPGFEDLGKLVVLRIACGTEGLDSTASQFRTDARSGLNCYRMLSRGRYACPTAESTGRSEISPVWLMHPGGQACGMLEDTRKAKRLIITGELELMSAHLSCFACNSFPAGVELICAALQQCVGLGLPALFVSVTEPDARNLRAALPHLEILESPATVYGTGLKPGLWNINTAEI